MSELFRGYVRTKDKKPIDSYKNARDEELRTLEEAKKFDEYGGVLRPDIVMIDVDDMHESEILFDIVRNLHIQCVVRKTTNGMHFLFKNNEKRITKNTVHDICAIGLTIDYKAGLKPSVEPLKFNGVERETLVEPDEIDECPAWLKPIATDKEWEGKNLVGLKDEQGRNQGLFNLIIDHVKAGLSRDESREAIRIVNSYVFAEPMGDKEIETITRDGAYEKVEEKQFFGDKGTFLHNMMGDYLIHQFHVCMIDSQLYSWDGSYYVQGSRPLERVMVDEIPIIRENQRREVLKYLNIVAPERETADPRYISFKNGIYDLETRTMIDPTPDIIITNQIPHNYEPHAECPLLDESLDAWSCNDDSIRANLEEVVGNCMYRSNRYAKMIVLIGDRANGKSTYLDLLSYIIGRENRTALEPKDFNEKFSVALMYGKLVNVCDDISDEYLSGDQVGTLKKIITGEEIKGEWKGENAFTFRPNAKIVASCNDMPRIKDPTGAVQRRMHHVPFDADFSEDKVNEKLKEELMTEECAEYMIRLGIEGLHRVIEQRHFTPSEKIKEKTNEYREFNNPLLMWLDCTDVEEEIVNQSTNQVYANYKAFCEDNGLQAMGHQQLVVQLKRKYKLKTKQRRKDGSRARYFIHDT